MRGNHAIRFMMVTLLALGGCGDKKGDGAPSASPDKATSATGKSSAAGVGSEAKPTTTTPAPTPRSGANASGPVAPLADIGKQLDEGFKAFLDGKDLATAFPGWSASAKDEAKLRADLKDAGAASATAANMEFELVMQKGDKDVYYLRTGVVPGEAAFASFDGRAETSVAVKSVDLAELTGDTAPLKTAADALFKMVSGAECEKVPLVSAGIGEKLGGGRMGEELTKALEKLTTSVPKTCKEIATAAPDKARLRIDDLGLVAKGADGKLVGLVGGSFEISNGKLVLSFKRFKKA